MPKGRRRTTTKKTTETKKRKQTANYYKAANKRKKPLFISQWLRGLWNLFSDLRLKQRTKRELNAVILIFFSGIIVLSLIGTAGIVGEWLKNIVTRTFGAGSFLLPFVFFGVATRLFMIKDKDKKKEDDKKSSIAKDYSIFRLYLGSFLFVAAILGLFHLHVPWDEIKHVAEQGESGGYVGFTVNFFLRPLFSSTGSLFVMIFLAIFSIQIALELSWKELFLFVVKFFKSEPETKQVRVKINKTEKKSVLTPITTKKVKEKETVKKEKIDTNFSIKNLNIPDDYKLPSLDLLDFEPFSVHMDLDEIMENKKIIKKTFADFNIPIYLGNEDPNTGELLFKTKEQILAGVSIGPTVTQYAFKPEAGVKLAKLTALQNDLALALAAKSLRIEAPIPGKSLVGVEIPNDTRSVVKLRSFFEADSFKKLNSNLRLNIGRDVSGMPIVADLAKMPHLLVAGATGSGKSVCINAFIISLLFQNSPQTLKFIMVDPKRVELSMYNGIPHLLAPVITDPEKTVAALRWAVAEMDRRYRLLSEKGYKNITDFNKAMPKEEKLPYMVILIDELADLMMVASKEVEGLICRLAQMARAIGIHLIVATQRPSVDVITGLIKANIPARIAFSVSSGVDSKTIIDTVGAERLLGAGDMLYLPSDENKPRRLQGIYLTSHEIRKLTNYIKSVGEPDYDENITEKDSDKINISNKNENLEKAIGDNPKLNFDVSNNYKIPGVDNFDAGKTTDDELAIQAMKVIIENKKASASFLQRRLRLGYARASRIIDLLEEKGFIGPQDGSKPRNILIGQEGLERLINESN
jgi:S-DNA-T family DNA segregation ATPase FtsK/SpoIIIE